LARKPRREKLTVSLLKEELGRAEAGGDEVVRNKLLPSGSSHALYSDVYNATRKHLVEAKAGTGRGDVRVAIGQLPTTDGSFPKARTGRFCSMLSHSRTYLFSSIRRESPRSGATATGL